MSIANSPFASAAFADDAEVNSQVILTGVSARTAISNVTDGLNVSYTRTAFVGERLAEPTTRQNSITFQTDSTGILLKSSYTEGEIWFEFGGGQRGVYSGIAKINNQYFIRFRSGNGSSGLQEQSDSAQFAVVNLAITDPSVSNFFDDQRHVVTWSIDVDNNKLLCWIDNKLIINYDAGANGGNVLRGDQWTGSDEGSYGQAKNSVAGGTDTFDGGATQYQYRGPSSTIEAGSSFFQLNGQLPNLQNYPVEVNGSALVTITGVSSATNVGQADAFAEFIAEVTGQELTTDLGTETVTGGATQVPTGEELSTFTGSVALQTDQVITPTSLLVQFTEGQVDRTVEQSFQPGNTFAGAPFASDEVISSEALVTGLNATSTTGTIGVATDQIIDVTGLQINSALGTAEGKGIAVAVVTGEQIDTQSGTLTTQTDNFIDVTGLQSNVALQNPTILAGGSVTVSAAEDQIEAEIGNFEILAGATGDPTGIQINSETGNLDITGSALVQPTGVEANFTTDNITIITSVSFDVTGQEVNTNTGNVEIFANADVIPTSEEIETNTGDVSIVVDATVPVTGQLISFETGEPIVTGTALIEPIGEEASTNLGDISINGDSSVTLTGLDLVFADGTAAIVVDAVATPTGLQISFSDGTLDVVGDANVLVTGQLISFALGKETISGAWEPVNPDATNSFSGVSPGVTNSFSGVSPGVTNTWTEVAA